MNLIEMSGVTKSIRSTFILDNVSLSFERGVICGLIGLNGAGKTTLMRVIAGLVLPSGGSVSYMGDESADALRKFRRNSGFFHRVPGAVPRYCGV